MSCRKWLVLMLFSCNSIVPAQGVESSLVSLCSHHNPICEIGNDQSALSSIIKRNTFQDKRFKEVHESEKNCLLVREYNLFVDHNQYKFVYNQFKGLLGKEISFMIMIIKNLKKEKMIDSKYTFLPMTFSSIFQYKNHLFPLY